MKQSDQYNEQLSEVMKYLVMSITAFLTKFTEIYEKKYMHILKELDPCLIT